MKIQELAEQVSSCPSAKDAKNVLEKEAVVVGVGTARLVIEHPEDKDKVVKLGAGYSGYTQNKNEVMVYQKACKNGVEERLLPVLDYGENYTWVSMPRIRDPSPVQTGKFTGPKSGIVHRELSENGIELYELETAMHEGTAVAYDYGSTENPQ